MNAISWGLDLCQWILLPIYLTSTWHFDSVIRVYEPVLLINDPVMIFVTIPFAWVLLPPSLDYTTLRRALFNTPLILHASMPTNMVALS